MRNVRRKLTEDERYWNNEGFDPAPHDPLFLTWDQARKITSGKPLEGDRDEEWMKAEAKALANKLSRTFNTSLKDKPTVTAMALKRYARQLPKMLAEEMISLGLIEDNDLDRLQQILDERVRGDAEVDDDGT
jgi:gluconate kinase